MSRDFVVPDWACKPPSGQHLDVYKEDRLIQKLMIDQKRCYFFGRNRELNDFCIDHSSCSRVHAALLYNKMVNRTYLVDLSSIHGTFIGNLRLEAQKPTPLPADSSFSFGASTRRYTIREKPQPSVDEGPENLSAIELPETETELEDLTKFNTARNKKLEMLGGIDGGKKSAHKRKMSKGVSFNEDEEVINPEDVDPSVGKFRNLVQSSVIAAKKSRMDIELTPSTMEIEASACSSLQNPSVVGLFASSGLSLPNPAPDVDAEFNQLRIGSPQRTQSSEAGSSEPRKKKYTKETWPGKKPHSHHFVQ